MSYVEHSASEILAGELPYATRRSHFVKASRDVTSRCDE